MVPSPICIHKKLSLRSMINTCLLQSGKSAAVYACAREQGFDVLEVLKS